MSGYAASHIITRLTNFGNFMGFWLLSLTLFFSLREV